MKTNQLFTSMLAVSALLVTSCSTSKLAKNTAIPDDVYNTTAQAKEYQAPAVEQQTTAKTDDYYGTSDPYYDMDYASRINRFYYANPWRTYYDSYYGYSPFGFNYFYSPFYNNSFWYGAGYYNFYNPYNYWSYYGNPYYNNYWGPISYYNPYYYYGGGGYYGNIGGGIRNSANYGPRPTRGSENGINRANGTSYMGGGSNGIVDRTSSAGSRAERYNPTNGNTPTTTSSGRSNGTTTSSTPTRSDVGDSRPTRSNDVPTRSTYTPPPTQSSPPPSSSSSGSRAESGSSSSGGGGGGRPTRGGGR